MRFAVEISVVVDGKCSLIGSLPIEFHLRDVRPRKPVSQRQQEIFDLVAAGKSNKEIAAQLFITERTVKFHISDLKRRLRVGSRVALGAEHKEQFCSGGQGT
jgi:DNA-binding NarL/FixJ family response regulator